MVTKVNGKMLKVAQTNALAGNAVFPDFASLSSGITLEGQLTLETLQELNTGNIPVKTKGYYTGSTDGSADYLVLTTAEKSAAGYDGLTNEAVEIDLGSGGTGYWFCLKKPKHLSIFDSVEELKGANLPQGQCISRYYYEKGDAGYARGIVKTAAQASTDGDFIDGFYNVTLANGNVWVGDNQDPINPYTYGLKDSDVSGNVTLNEIVTAVEALYVNNRLRIDFQSRNVDITESIICNGAKVGFINGTWNIKTLGVWQDNSILHVTNKGGQVTLASYRNIAESILENMYVTSEDNTVDFIYAYETGTLDPNNSTSTLHCVKNVRISNVAKAFKHGTNGWGWNWISCGFRSCAYGLYITAETNTYERHSLWGCIFQNGSGYAISCSNSDGKVYWHGGSVDYCGGGVELSAGYVEMNTHIEFGNRYSSNPANSWANITGTGHLLLSGGTIALREESGGSQYYLINQVSDYQVTVRDIIVLTDGSNVGLFSNKRFKSSNLNLQNIASSRFFFVEDGTALTDMRAVDVELAGTGLSVTTQNSTDLVITSSVGAGGAKGVNINIPLKQATCKYISYEMTASSDSNTFIDKALISANKLYTESKVIGDQLIDSVEGLKNFDGQSLEYTEGFTTLKLSINCVNLSSSQELRISGFKYWNL